MLSSGSNLLVTSLRVRQRLGENQRICRRDGDQNAEIEQLQLRGKVCIIGKRTQRVDGGVDQDAGEQAAAAAFTPV